MKRPLLAVPSRATLKLLTRGLAALALLSCLSCKNTSCEEMCHTAHEDCSSQADEEQQEACDAELSRCYGICASQPSDPSH